MTKTLTRMLFQSTRGKRANVKTAQTNEGRRNLGSQDLGWKTSPLLPYRVLATAGLELSVSSEMHQDPA